MAAATATTTADDERYRQRVVAHIDLDCFFVQVERMRRPHLKALPIAVFQHQDIISVSYEARALGVRKHDNTQQVACKHPNVTLVSVAKEEGTSKVSYKSYAATSDAVVAILKRYSDRVEKASIDEAFIELGDHQASTSTSTTSTCSSTPHTLDDCDGGWHGQVIGLDGRVGGAPLLPLPSEQLLKQAASVCMVGSSAVESIQAIVQCYGITCCCCCCCCCCWSGYAFFTSASNEISCTS
jgi:nucleotidyltransferase/DNA polymerase involved in DNA repair